jgi:hypothetical protein
MATYTLISSNVLSSSAASVTFSAIPATYTDLVVRCSLRNDAASEIGRIILTINSTSAGYSSTRLYADGSTVTSARTSGGSDVFVLGVNGSTSTSNSFGSVELYIPSYTASQNKPISAVGFPETNAATFSANPAYGTYALLWSNTAAITALNLATNNNWQSGSSFYLYGISNA